MTFSEDRTGRIDQLMALLADENLLSNQQPLTSIEIAETLWLALQIEPIPEPIVELSPLPISQESEPSEPAINTARSQPLPPPSPPPLPSPKASLTTPPPQAGILPTKALPVWLADPALLNDPLAIVRALKPLLQMVEAGIGRKLDEPETVEYIARTGLCVPILRPEREPWFDIILIVDRGSSMHIWQRLITDLERILRRYGAFRDVRVFDLEIDRKAPQKERVLLKSQRAAHRPSELIDQVGRRIAIVLSDCAGSYWWDGTLLPIFASWARVMPTVIWQMLPAWMWARTALGRGDTVALSNDRPGAVNQQLILRSLKREEPEEIGHRVSVPIVTSEMRDLSNWSLMLAGNRREVTPGVLLPRFGGSVPRSKTIEEIARDRVELEGDIEAEIEAITRVRVERFRELSSPHAQRLMMLLAAAPVITLPVMRLIRDSMLYEAKSPLAIAEVFLSGLLQALPGQDGIDPDLVQYDFISKARKVLLEVLPEVDTIEVINSVSAAVEKQWNQFATQDFQAFLVDPKIEEPEGLEGLRSFANVTADILEQLGGNYVDFARQLRQGASEESAESSELEDVSFPELEPFEFIDAQLVEEVDSGFPKLETEEVEVITIVLEDEAAIEFQSFEFEVATLHRPEPPQTEWTIHRQRHQRIALWVEPLAQGFDLEMILIPGGTFVMGSPENERDRSSRESPQHEVTLSPFMMGRYPVTQAQWRIVAAMPQISRNLSSSPSQFKEDQCPVEQISWYEAVEFCERLSVYTGHEYRLPTEAEWEYACRAGTTTPFQFGETITSSLGNYNGGTSYLGESMGEYRKKTTPVDYFGIANAFGLSEMHGNVFEWCQDHWHGSYAEVPLDGSAWFTENERTQRVQRGGSWSNAPSDCRSAYRSYDRPDYRYNDIGFRVVCSAPRTLLSLLSF